MNLFITILSLGVLSTMIVNQVVKNKRYKYIGRLEFIYSKMELIFATKKIPISRDYKEILRAHKNLVVNPEYLDIQILHLMKRAGMKNGTLQKHQDWFEKTMDTLPEEFRALSEEFSLQADTIVNLSILKYDFVFFFFRNLCVHAVKNSFQKIGTILQNERDYLLNNELTIAYAGKKYASKNMPIAA